MSSSEDRKALFDSGLVVYPSQLGGPFRAAQKVIHPNGEETVSFWPCVNGCSSGGHNASTHTEVIVSLGLK
jgi:hypothetical protein